MYNKLFTKILDSSIWMEPITTRIVWITLIAAMDEDGFVQFAGVNNVAHRAVVSFEDAEKAIKTLESPDANSSDPENEGRRIERVPGGWIVLNSRKYRDLVKRENIKDQTRERVRKFRESKASVAGKRVTQRNATKRSGNADVRIGNELVTPSEADTDTKTREAETAPASPPTPPAVESKKPRKPRAPKPPEMSDGEWLESLKAKPDNAGKDVGSEYAKMLAWCERKRETPTRRRFEAWLKRIEQPLALPAASAPKKPFVPEPHRGIFTQKDLDDLNASYG